MASPVTTATVAPAAAAHTAASPAASTTPSSSDADNARAMRFQYAMSAALNAPHVLGGASGSTADDDDDDGSSLTVKIGM